MPSDIFLTDCADFLSSLVHKWNVPFAMSYFGSNHATLAYIPIELLRSRYVNPGSSLKLAITSFVSSPAEPYTPPLRYLNPTPAFASRDGFNVSDESPSSLFSLKSYVMVSAKSASIAPVIPIVTGITHTTNCQSNSADASAVTHR